MDIGEFDALRVDDRIRNAEGHIGTVQAVRPTGLMITWGNSPLPFFLHRMGTAWYGMDVVRDIKPGCAVCEGEACKCGADNVST